MAKRSKISKKTKITTGNIHSRSLNYGLLLAKIREIYVFLNRKSAVFISVMGLKPGSNMDGPKLRRYAKACETQQVNIRCCKC